jgi:hypothetical protein
MITGKIDSLLSANLESKKWSNGLLLDVYGPALITSLRCIRSLSPTRTPLKAICVDSGMEIVSYVHLKKRKIGSKRQPSLDTQSHMIDVESKSDAVSAV